MRLVRPAPDGGPPRTTLQIGAEMTAVPVLAILSAAVLLGLYLGLLYLRGERKPVLIGAHFLLGAGGLEALVMLLHGTPDGAAPRTGSLGTTAALFFVISIISGVSAALLRRSRVIANTVLAAHAGVGAIGFMLLLYWVSSP
jgi:hypothetical protein